MKVRQVALIFVMLSMPQHAFAETQEIPRLDTGENMEHDARASIVGFAKDHVGQIIGLKASIPQTSMVESEFSQKVRFPELGWDGPDGRHTLFCPVPMDHGDDQWQFLVRIMGGFSHANRRRRVTEMCGGLNYVFYTVEGFFEVRPASATKLGKEIYELVPIDQPDNSTVKTIITWPQN